MSLRNSRKSVQHGGAKKRVYHQIDKTGGRAIVKDAIPRRFDWIYGKGRAQKESMVEAWQEYLLQRPLQDEEEEVPRGFELEEVEDGEGNKRAKVKINPKTGQPVITWRSLREVTEKDFYDVGPGVAMSYP